MTSIDLSNPRPQTADFSQIWPSLEVGVHKLIDFPENILPNEYLNLSVTVSNLAKPCALDTQKNLMEFFIKRVQLVAEQAEKMVDVELLRYYVKEFHIYKTGVERVNRVFAYYNRRWKNLDVILPVDLLGLTQWKENCALVIQRGGRKLTCAILDLITKERNGEGIEEDLVKNAIDSFVALDINPHSPGSFYQEEFAAPFLQTMADFHKKELEQVFQSEDFISDYLNKVEEKVLEEEERAKRYLPQPLTHDEVTRTLLISEHCEALAQVLLQNNDDEKLRGIYTLLSRIKPDGLEALKESIGLHFKTESGGGSMMNAVPDIDHDSDFDFDPLSKGAWVTENNIQFYLD